MKTSVITFGICLLFILLVAHPMTLGYDVKIGDGGSHLIVHQWKVRGR
jgi:hypothetical protein